MKVNEDKAKELLALADHWKKTSQALLNFETKNDLGIKIGLNDFVHLIGKAQDNITKLIYETFLESQ